jgi:hypothetical protein
MPLTNPAVTSALALNANVDDLETRLTAARAGYLDNLSAGAVALQSSITTLLDALYGANGIVTWTTGAAAGNGVSLAEALRYTQNLAEDLSTGHQRYIATPANMTLPAWNTVAAHRVFVVTGTVRLCMWITCTGTLQDAVDLATLSFGYEGSNAAFIATTDAAGKNAQTLTAGQLWFDSSPVSGPDTFANTVMDYVVPNGLDVGYEVAGEALTGGSLVFHCVWWPLDATGAVTIGDGSGFGA